MAMLNLFAVDGPAALKSRLLYKQKVANQKLHHDLMYTSNTGIAESEICNLRKNQNCQGWSHRKRHLELIKLHHYNIR